MKVNANKRPRSFLPLFLPGLYVLCLYKAQVSGERLQDNWSSGLIFVGIGVTFACDDFIFYVI